MCTTLETENSEEGNDELQNDSVRNTMNHRER